MELLIQLMAVFKLGMEKAQLILPLVPLLGMFSQHHQHHEHQQEWGMREKINLFYALVTIHCATITPFLRKGFGKEALTWPGIYAFLLILIVAGLNGSPAMLIYLLAWMGMLLVQRLYTWKQYRLGNGCHSKYEGRSLIPFISDKVARGLFEPVICLCAGGYSLYIGEQVVGLFLLVGIFSLIFRQGIDQTIDSRRIQAMRDAAIEQQWYAQEARKQRSRY